MEQEEIHVLYVDDEENNLNAFKASFRRDFKIHIALSAKEAEEILENNLIHILITDQRMPETNGSELLRRAVKKYPEQIRILLTGYSDMDALTDAVNNGKIYKYIQKPWNNDELREVIKEAYDVYNLVREKEKLTETLMLTNEQLEFYLRQKLLS